MRTGRPPKPIELHKRQGSHRPDRQAATPVVLGGRTLPKPAAGTAPDVRKAFREIVKVLADANILDAADTWAVEACAAQLCRARAAAALVSAHGMTVSGVQGGGGRIANPAVKMERDAQLAWLRFAEQLGLTPAMRAKLANHHADVGQGRDSLPGMGELIPLEGGATR